MSHNKLHHTTAEASSTAATISSIVWQRLSVLVSLLLLQSLSQFVLAANEGLIASNIVIPLFLTMLVGAGGNAGNQAAVRSITGLVTGEFKPAHVWRVLRKEAVVGIVCASVLFLIGFVRVHYFYSSEDSASDNPLYPVFAISISLFLIVLISVVLGCLLPFLMLRLGMNIEHAAPTIQVLMDLVGVIICCGVASLMLPTTTPAPTNSLGSIPPSQSQPSNTVASAAAAGATEGLGAAL